VLPDATAAVNSAETDCAALIETVQVPTPAHPAPDQPLNVEPLAGVAVSVTVLLPASTELQPLVAPVAQSMPPPVTVPVPVPAVSTERMNEPAAAVNVAVTAWTEFMVTVHAPVPEQPAPDQPEKLEPLLGTAVRVTLCPAGKAMLHVGVQESPAGLERMVPEPVPASVTSRA